MSTSKKTIFIDKNPHCTSRNELPVLYSILKNYNLQNFVNQSVTENGISTKINDKNRFTSHCNISQIK